MKQIVVGLCVMLAMVTGGWATDPPTKVHGLRMVSVTPTWVGSTTLRVSFQYELAADSTDPALVEGTGSGLSYAFVLAVKTPNQQVVNVSTLQNNTYGGQECGGGCSGGYGIGCSNGCGFWGSTPGQPTGHCSQNGFDGGAAYPCGYRCCYGGSCGSYTYPMPVPTYGACGNEMGTPGDWQYPCSLCTGIGIRNHDIELGVYGAEAIRGGSVQVSIEALNFTDATDGNDVGSGGIPQ